MPVFFAVILLGCVSTAPQSPSPTAPSSTFIPSQPLDFQQTTLSTSDGQRIAAIYLPSSNADDVGTIFLHMLGRDKSTWKDFMAGISHPTVAIDFRGHGQSSGDMATFTDADYNNFILDVKAAADFLASKGAKKFYLVGASIGANVALAYAIGDSRVEKIALLSPGLDYRGVKTEGLPARYSGESFFAAAQEDEYSYASTQQLYSEAKQPKTLEILQGNAHGTGMLNDEALSQKLYAFLK